MIVMSKHKLARLLAIVFITLLGTISIMMVPFLFARGNMKWSEFSGSIELLLLFLCIGLVVGAVSYVILKLFQGSNH